MTATRPTTEQSRPPTTARATTARATTARATTARATTARATTPLAEPAIVIFDMDGVLLSLGLRTEHVREAIRQLFAAEGFADSFRPLLAGLDRACAAVAERSGEPARADALREQAWALIDAEERRAARGCRPLPGARRLLRTLHRRGVPLALFTNNHHEAAVAALQVAGIDPGWFFAIEARRQAASLKPAARPVLDLAAAAPAAPRTVYLVGDHPLDMASATLAAPGLAARSTPAQIVPIGLLSVARRQDPSRAAALEAEGAWFIAADHAELEGLLAARPAPVSLSIVLLAYNEQDQIAAAIADARRLCRLLAQGARCEVVVVDDGSTDDTAARAERASEGDVVLVRHPVNLGMGAAMRDGYLAASGDYILHLPGDRQVRPQVLAPLLPLLRPDRVVLTTYLAPPSGEGRELVSGIFRWLTRRVGGMSVNFAGTYIFHRRWLERIDLRRLGSSSFLFSFELLERLRRAGCEVVERPIHNFRREGSTSRVFAPRRIARVAAEILACRARALFD